MRLILANHVSYPLDLIASHVSYSLCSPTSQVSREQTFSIRRKTAVTEYTRKHLQLKELESRVTSSTTVGSRSILRDLVEPDLSSPDAAVDLNSSNFESVLRGSPASFAVLEFFASWCPACRNYKPQYEKVARLFNGPDVVHPGVVLMVRVDCADKIWKCRAQ